jgi:hypothetical protein
LWRFLYWLYMKYIMMIDFDQSCAPCALALCLVVSDLKTSSSDAWGSSRQNGLLQAWGTHPQLNWMLPRITQYCQTTSSKLIKYINQGLGFQGISRHKSLKQTRGQMKLLRWRCRSRPPPLIPQRSTTLVGWGRISCKLGGSNNGAFHGQLEHPLRKKEGV